MKQVKLNLKKKRDSKIFEMQMDSNTLSGIASSQTSSYPQQALIRELNSKRISDFQLEGLQTQRKSLFADTKLRVSSQPSFHVHKNEDLPEQIEEKKYIEKPNAVQEIYERQKEIMKETMQKTYNDQLIELKKFQQDLLNHQSNQKSEIQLMNSSTKRQIIYKQIYETVKQVTGTVQNEEINQKRDQEILQFISTGQKNEEQIENKTRGQSYNLKRSNTKHFLSNNTQKQMQELQQKNVKSRSPSRSNTQKNSIIRIQSPTERITDAIKEVNVSSEDSPDKKLSKCEIQSSESSNEGQSEVEDLKEDFQEALERVFEKSSNRRQSQFYRKENMVQVEEQSQGLRRQSSMNSIYKSPLMLKFSNANIKVKRNSTVLNKQIDQELLHILITRWRNVKQNDAINQLHLKNSFHNMRKKEFGIRTNQKSSTRVFRQEDVEKRQRRYFIGMKLLQWLQKMNRCKISLQMWNEKMDVFPTKAFNSVGSYVLKQYKIA